LQQQRGAANPGFFSAPHSYATDRIQVVVSGVWWVNSGCDFAPDDAVPVKAGGFVKRTARTPIMTAFRGMAASPRSIIAVFGMGPVDIELCEPGKRPGAKLSVVAARRSQQEP
jgi:hypothetical protein